MEEEEVEDDGFECFVGDDDEEEDEDNDNRAHESFRGLDQNEGNDVLKDGGEDSTQETGIRTATVISRHPDAGVLSFHAGTEQALLVYVTNQLRISYKLEKDRKAEEETTGANTANDDDDDDDMIQQAQRRIQRANQVLRLVDQFCMERHWMMHIGPEKALHLTDFVRESYECHSASSSASLSTNLFVLLELGSYCGYSAIHFCRILLQQYLAGKQQQQQLEGATISSTTFHIVSVDVNPHTLSVAQRLIDLADCGEYVTLLLLDWQQLHQQQQSSIRTRPKSLLVDLLWKNSPNSKQRPFQFVFFDHDKQAYLSDLLALEEAGYVSEGTYVAADNVIFAGIDDYRQYIHQATQNGTVTTRLVEGPLEYSDETDVRYRDGIELSKYLKKPN